MSTTDNTNPFPGLRPFLEEEERLFFGRERQIETMISKLADTRFLAVVGASGSGKSSLVNCGLLPALHHGQMTNAGKAWRMAQFRPGGDPLGKMADALAKDGVLYTNFDGGIPLREIIATNLSMRKQGLLESYKKARLPEDVNLLVVVDQFEELFRFGKQEASLKANDYGVSDEAIAFVNLLLTVREQTQYPIYVVLTMRSDFLGDCAQLPGLPEAINEGQFLVPRMTRDERRAAISGPVGVGRRELAQKVEDNGQVDDDEPVGEGWAQITPVLLTRLVNDLGDNPDQLSILQHALNRAWARWENEGQREGPLNLTHYKAIGTMDSALDQHAEKAYRELGDEDGATETTPLDERTNGETRAKEKPPSRKQKICEKIFKALTDKFEGRSIRRPTKLGTLCALAKASEAEVIEVIDVFRKPSRSFLMPPAGEALEAETVIDISHESLMRVWQRLKEWAEEEAESAQMYRRLTEAATLYKEGKAGLWRDPQLQLALAWREQNHLTPAWAKFYQGDYDAAMRFLDESLALREKEAQAEEARLQRERKNALALATEQGRAEQAQALAAAQAEAAEQAKALAEEQRIRAEAQTEAAKQAQALAEEQRLRAEEQEKATKRLRRRLFVVIALTLFAFVWVFLAIQQRREAQVQAGYAELQKQRAVAYADTMKIFADSSEARRKRADSLRYIADSLRGLAQDSAAAALRLRGIALREAGLANALRLAALASSRLDSRPDLALLLSLEGIDHERQHLTEAQSTLLTALQNYSHLNKTLRGHQSAVSGVAFSPDGAQLASSSADSTIRLWDARTGALRKTLKGDQGEITSVAFSPDSMRMATASRDHTVVLWDLESIDQKRETLTGHEAEVYSVAFSPDNARLASGSKDGTIRLWDARTGEPLETLEGHESDVFSVAFSSTGDTLASGSEDNTIIVWNARTGERLKTLGGEEYHDNDVMSVAFSPYGPYLASGSKDKTVIVWDLATDEPAMRLEGHQSGVTSVAFSSDFEHLASGSEDRTIIVWEFDTGQPMHVLKGHQNNVTHIAFSPDGRQLASGSEDNTIRLWEIEDDETVRPLSKPLQTLNTDRRPVPSVAFSPDGKRLASGGYQMVILRETQTGEPLDTLYGHEDFVMGLAFSPSGDTLASGSYDGTIRLWDAQTGRSLGDPLTGHEGKVYSVAFNSDGTRLASGDHEGSVRLWDAQSGEPLKTLEGHEAYVHSVAFSPEGKRLASGSGDNTIIVWDLEQDRRLYTLEEHQEEVLNVAFSPDGRRLASGSYDGTIRLWDAQTGRSLGDPLTGHEAAIMGLAFSPDGRLLASGSFDNTLRLWDAQTGAPLGEPLEGHEENVRSVAFSPDGRRLASSSDDGTVRLWNVDLEAWKAQACRIAQRNLTVNEWRQYMMKQEDRLDPMAILSYSKTCEEHPVDPGFQALAEERARLGYRNRSYIAEARALFEKILELKSEAPLSPGDRAAQAQRLIGAVLVAHGDSLVQQSPFDEERFEEAVAAFTEAKRIDRSLVFNTRARAWTEYGRQRAREGLIEEAKAAFTKALRIDPSLDLDPETEAQRLAAPLWVERGGAMARRGDLAGAIAAFEQAKAWDPSLEIDPETKTDQLAAEGRDQKVRQGETLAQAGRVDDAIDAFNEAKKIDPALAINPQTKAQRLAAPSRIKEGEALAREGRVDDAIAAFEQANAWDPSLSIDPVTKARGLVAEVRDEKLEQGRTLARTGQIEEAKAAFTEALGIDPSLDLNPETPAPDHDPQAEAQRLVAPRLIERGGDLARRGDLAGAIAAFEQAKAWDPSREIDPETAANERAAPFRVLQGEDLARAGKLAEAIVAFTEAKRWKPSLDIDPATEARQFFDQARDKKIEAGKARAQEGAVEAAIAAFEQAQAIDSSLAFDPETEARRLAAPYLVSRGKALAQRGQVDEAIAIFERARAWDPTLDLNPETQAPDHDPQAEARRLAAPLWLEQGEYLARRGNIEEAIAAFERAQALDSTLEISSVSWNNLCWLGSLWRYAEAGAWRYAEAILAACENAVQPNPEDPALSYARDSRGVARALTGNIEGAIEDFQFYVEHRNYKERVPKRQAWIRELREGRNPFDDKEILEKLKGE